MLEVKLTYKIIKYDCKELFWILLMDKVMISNTLEKCKIMEYYHTVGSLTAWGSNCHSLGNFY